MITVHETRTGRAHIELHTYRLTPRAIEKATRLDLRATRVVRLPRDRWFVRDTRLDTLLHALTAAYGPITFHPFGKEAVVLTPETIVGIIGQPDAPTRDLLRLIDGPVFADYQRAEFRPTNDDIRDRFGRSPANGAGADTRY